MLRFTRLSHFAVICTLAAASFQSFASPAAAHAAYVQDDDKKSKAKEDDNDRDVRSNAALWAQIRNPVLWHQPKDIARLDLLNGQGGRDKQPRPPFVFESEDMGGTNPKMDVRDAGDKKWRVKAGEEARPEVVASRLLWAMGYFVNDDYFLPSATVSNVKVKRGPKEWKAGQLQDVRFARKPAGQKKIGIWEWKTNPFYGKREFNGLRVMMAVMNNWDLKDENNAVYTDKKSGQQLFLVSDVGASFGSNGIGWTKASSKGNIDSFKDSKFVTRLTTATVDFGTPRRPTGMLFATAGVTAKSFAMRANLDWIGREVPREDARWIGGMLAQLSHRQLTDAFRAGGFPDEVVTQYVTVVESRIAELKKL
ncbi:hypothetical protein Terro_2678 [Terriglobus roseus DSM 18391]|uniref:Uncharacterized protein n=1 Tax=Terriglobus roseus (strain DSM 18391 / NRRL B-41598 / KBS 63) TaxID=926566 RepID=I3ZI48_TERRK|nr:hypothetical protein [Terriglobus roseus]AFL88575.1 hypothetical protein Terro_2314 [Terriglobus roseus DSM 18391]AFL88916.1 hypothetical protein Terro_2678 [Terriglobus roseus DSM 18391]